MMANLFEPFSTTKETGEETGLELAKIVIPVPDEYEN